MGSLKADKKHFLFLCSQERKKIYQDALSASNYSFDVVFIETIEELLAQCLKQPPSAILMDIVTKMRIGPEDMKIVDNLGVCWPLMICNVNPDGQVQAISLALSKQDSFISALTAIVEDDPDWKNPVCKRRFVRIELNSRVLIKKENRDCWEKANVLNISMGGLFAVTYADYNMGDNVDMRILDLKEKPIECKGKIVWVRCWDKSVMLPGVGVDFSDHLTPPDIAHVLTSDEIVKRFCEQAKK